jgi:hypothetical protein
MTQIHEDFSRARHVKAASNRAFGGVFAAVFLIVAWWPVAFGGALRWWSLIVSALVLLVTIAAPALLAVPNRLWLRFGLLLNRIISPVVLAVLFYAVITPAGVMMRVFRRDPLRLRRDGAAQSYWIKRDPPGPEPASMSNQF